MSVACADGIVLTPEQEAAMEGLLRFGEPIQTLGGYAGTGKTSLIARLIEHLPDFAVCAFTGKAANVLRSKGIQRAQTIHSLIYEIELDNDGKPVLDSNGQPNFVLRASLGCAGVIVDEASMVGSALFDGLASFGLPLIFVGDHGQLEPVGEGLNLMVDPTFRLETIHRNAGEIAHFAEWVRQGNPPARFRTGGKVHFLSRGSAPNFYDQADQIICAFNRTRVDVNRSIRATRGYTPFRPQVGDRVMCLRNSKKLGLYNGMQGTITEMSAHPSAALSFSDGLETYKVSCDLAQFNKEKLDYVFVPGVTPLDYAYCITAHKSQGSEYGKVMVLEQQCQHWDHIRWAYTAASRAKDVLLWVNAD